MVMEAMRLSLLDHEEQQRKQQEEEQKKKRETGSAIEPAASSGAGPSSTDVSTNSPSTGETSPMLLSPVASSPTTRHRSSSSLSRRSGELFPGSGRGSQRSPSPASAIGMAIWTATSAASAVGSPPAEQELAGVVTASPTAEGVVTVTSPEGEQATATIEHDTTRPEATPTTSTAPLPMERNMSFASSFAHEMDGSTYDYLPSSPGSSTSSLAQQPLLDSPSVPPQTPGIVEGTSRTVPQAE